MGQIRNELFFKLWPTAAGNHRHFHNTEKVMQKSGHFRINGRFTVGKCAIEIKHLSLIHIYASL